MRGLSAACEAPKRNAVGGLNSININIMSNEIKGSLFPKHRIIEIPLTRGEVSIIDEIDADKVLPFKWTLLSCGAKRITKKMYARRTVHLPSGKQKTILLHHIILPRPDDKNLVVDHINGNSLDNRRCNLRIATRSQNRTSARFMKSVAGFYGVKSNKMTYFAQIHINGIPFRSLPLQTPVEAARAYDVIAKIAYGEFAYLNFPDE